MRFATSLGIIEVLLLGGPLVVVPLGLLLLRRTSPPLAAAGTTHGIELRLIAAGLVALSFVVPSGAAAAALTFPWLIGSLALVPAATARRARTSYSDRLAAVGVLWLPLAAAAITVTRGWPDAAVLGVTPELVRLTGVHLTYAGFGAAVIAASAVRAATRLDRHGRLAATAAALTVGGAVVVAVGHLTVRALELAGALAVTAGVVGLGVASWSLAPRGSLARVLLRVSGVSVLGSMGFAIAYAWALTVGAPHLPYTTIAAVHGTINALGFTVAGLLGWLRWVPPDVPPDGQPEREADGEADGLPDGEEGQVSRRVRSSNVSRRTTTRDSPSRTNTTAGRGSRL